MEKNKQKATKPGGGVRRPRGRPHSPETAIAQMMGVLDLSELLRCETMLPGTAIICVTDEA